MNSQLTQLIQNQQEIFKNSWHRRISCCFSYNVLHFLAKNLGKSLSTPEKVKNILMKSQYKDLLRKDYRKVLHLNSRETNKKILKIISSLIDVIADIHDVLLYNYEIEEGIMNELINVEKSLNSLCFIRCNLKKTVGWWLNSLNLQKMRYIFISSDPMTNIDIDLKQLLKANLPFIISLSFQNTNLSTGCVKTIKKIQSYLKCVSFIGHLKTISIVFVKEIFTSINCSIITPCYQPHDFVYVSWMAKQDNTQLWLRPSCLHNMLEQYPISKRLWISQQIEKILGSRLLMINETSNNFFC